MRRLLHLSMLIITVLTLQRPISVSAAPGQASDPITLSLRTSEHARYVSELPLQGKLWERELDSLPDGEPVSFVPYSDAYLTIRLSHTAGAYLVDDYGYLYDSVRSMKIALSEQLRRRLAQHVTRLRAKHYGVLRSWEDMKQRFPRKHIFTVTDIETGLTFRVQRRAGSAHADVQPVTRQDTAIMKQIYNGDWSWKRRAILIAHEDKSQDNISYAASMHGMPHGGDGIPGNNFKGHFCIHFMGSTTHGSGNVDLDHQLMVLKAAGQLRLFYGKATPSELVRSYFSALNQQDEVLLDWCFPYMNHPLLAETREEMRRIVAVRIDLDDRQDRRFEDVLAEEIQVRADLYREGEGRTRQRYTFLITRDTCFSPWKIDHIARR